MEAIHTMNSENLSPNPSNSHLMILDASIVCWLWARPRIYVHLIFLTLSIELCDTEWTKCVGQCSVNSSVVGNTTIQRIH